MAAPSCIAFYSEQKNGLTALIVFGGVELLLLPLGFLYFFWWSVETLLLLPLGFLYFVFTLRNPTTTQPTAPLHLGSCPRLYRPIHPHLAIGCVQLHEPLVRHLTHVDPGDDGAAVAHDEQTGSLQRRLQLRQDASISLIGMVVQGLGLAGDVVVVRQPHELLLQQPLLGHQHRLLRLHLLQLGLQGGHLDVHVADVAQAREPRHARHARVDLHIVQQRMPGDLLHAHSPLVLPAPRGAILRRTGACVTLIGDCRALRTRHGRHGCDLLGLRDLLCIF